MNIKTICTNHYLLLVEETEIKDGEWLYDEEPERGLENIRQLDSNVSYFGGGHYKIIAYLPIGISNVHKIPKLGDLPLLPEFDSRFFGIHGIYTFVSEYHRHMEKKRYNLSDNPAEEYVKNIIKKHIKFIPELTMSIDNNREIISYKKKITYGMTDAGQYETVITLKGKYEVL